MENKLNYKRTFFIGLAFLSISAFWQLYDNIVPLIMQNTFGMKETVTGTVMAMDNVLALILLPIFGTLSDKADTRFGKRTPFIVCGTILAVAFMMLLPIADRGQNLPLFVVALFFTLISMGLYRSQAVALMPDLTPNHLRSRGNAVINLMGAVGGVYTLIMIKLLVGDGKTPDYLPLYVSAAALMVIAVGVLVITIRENNVAWAAIGVNSYPMIVAMSKSSDVGKFTGTYYTFSMAAQILTPILSGALLENISYRTLFPYALVFSLLALLTMTQVRHGDVRPEKKANVLEHFEAED